MLFVYLARFFCDAQRRCTYNCNKYGNSKHGAKKNLLYFCAFRSLPCIYFIFLDEKKYKMAPCSFCKRKPGFWSGGKNALLCGWTNKNINYICLFGLIPFAYSSVYNNTNFHSMLVLIFGFAFHTRKNNKILHILDVFQCFCNGGFVFYSNYDSRMYGFVCLLIFCINTKYYQSNCLHVLLQLSAWKGISIYENSIGNCTDNITHAII